MKQVAVSHLKQFLLHSFFDIESAVDMTMYKAQVMALISEVFCNII